MVLAAVALGSASLATAAGNEVGATAATRAVYAYGGYGFTPTLGEPIASNSATGANSPYRFWIEVPAGTPNLVVDLFDPNIDTDAAGLGLDFLQGAANTTAQYRLYDPSGVQNGAPLVGDAAGPAGGDNAWLNFRTIANPAPGHWRLEIDQTFAVRAVTDEGNDVNAVGLRAYATPGQPASTADVELNVYYDSYTNYGLFTTGTTATRTWEDYPWVTAGCSAFGDNFDADDTAGSDNSFRFRSFGAGYDSTALQAGAGTNLWDRDSYTDFARFPASPFLFEQFSRNYGIGTLNVTVTNVVDAGGGTGGNYIPFKMGRFNAVNYAPNLDLPDQNPLGDTFRVYLPNDAGTAPLKPRMAQRVEKVDNDPLQVGVPSLHRVDVFFTNPTPHAVTFSASNTLSANVPGGSVVYGGGASVSQGALVSTPAPGGAGNVVANPGTVAANTEVTLSYLITVTPPDALLLNVTGTETTNGTQARYVDETGDAANAQATYTFGPLCPVAVRVGVGLEVTMGEMVATINEAGQVVLAWETLAERRCAGFHVVAEGGRLTPDLVPAQGTDAAGATYVFTDTRPWLDGEVERAYFVEEIELSGLATMHGPATVRRAVATSAVEAWARY